MEVGAQLFKYPEALLESETVEKLTDAQLSASHSLQNILKGYINNKRTKIVAYLGDFGCGKSDVINDAVHNLLKNYIVRFVKFDIWQYQSTKMI